MEDETNMISCEECEHCLYVEHGDMFCELTYNQKEGSVELVYNNFIPTDSYMWCRSKKYSYKVKE